MPKNTATINNKDSSKSEKRTAEIYRVAANLIKEKGYHATSMNDIAKRLKLTKAGLYYYIDGKSDLLFSIIQFGMKQLEDQVVLPCRAIADPEDRLRQIIEKHTVLILDLGGAISILTDEVQKLPLAQRREIVAMKRGYMDLMRNTLRQLGVQKKMRQLNTNVTAMNVFALILGVARWYNPKKGWSSARVSREVSKFAMGAVLNDDDV